MVPPNHPILIGFSLFSPSILGFSPYFWISTHIHFSTSFVFFTLIQLWSTSACLHVAGPGDKRAVNDSPKLPHKKCHPKKSMIKATIIGKSSQLRRDKLMLPKPPHPLMVIPDAEASPHQRPQVNRRLRPTRDPSF